jgi:CDP-glucose 4,6-dehydratase
MTREFWRNRRVLLTGHTGFKGAWLSLWLQHWGAQVTGLALAPSTEPSLFEAARIGSGIRSEIGDVRDLAFVERVVTAAQPEIVLHLAAQALVLRSYREPLTTYSTNVLGTAHVLDAVRRLAEPRALVVITSDKCYENREWLWPYREDEAMGGPDPYSSSKGCAELVAAAYRKSYFAPKGIGVASARAGNVIGGGDWSENRLIVDLVRGFSKGSPVLIRAPRAIRPWQHVLDALSGYLLLAERLHADPVRYSEGWNFGPTAEDALEVGPIADRMVARWGEGAKWFTEEVAGPHEANLLILDASKARKLLGWRPRLTLDTALDWIVDWHKAQVRGDDMRALTLHQLEKFLALGTDT